MPKYPVKQPLKYDGDNFSDGDLVDMSKEQAQGLIDAGVIGQATKPAKANKPAKPTKPEDQGALTAAIVAAVESMDKEDQSLRTGDGTPKVEALSTILGYTVSAAERDAALTPTE